MARWAQWRHIAIFKSTEIIAPLCNFAKWCDVVPLCQIEIAVARWACCIVQFWRHWQSGGKKCTVARRGAIVPDEKNAQWRDLHFALCNFSATGRMAQLATLCHVICSVF